MRPKSIGQSPSSRSIQIFNRAARSESLCEAGQLSQACAQIFRFGRSAASAGIIRCPCTSIKVGRISLASAGESYWTTGTGSGKSLSYFIPIIDHCLKARQVDKTPRTRAIVVYPMNALANSQLEELKKFLGADPGTRPVTFGRFTGQESTEEREAMKANPAGHLADQLHDVRAAAHSAERD